MASLIEAVASNKHLKAPGVRGPSVLFNDSFHYSLLRNRFTGFRFMVAFAFKIIHMEPQYVFIFNGMCNGISV